MLVIEKKGQTVTTAMKQVPEMPETPRKALSNIYILELNRNVYKYNFQEHVENS